jgi:dolichol kinase
MAGSAAFTVVTALWFKLWCGEAASAAVFKGCVLAVVEHVSGDLDNLALPVATLGLNWAVGPAQ